MLRLPFGALGVVIVGDALTELHLLPPGTPELAPCNRLSERVCTQLRDYLGDPARAFDLPVRAAGTPFQHRVWQCIAAIPCGETRRYGELSAHLGSAARAVGQACGANPLPLVVPCHRVVAAAGIGGFANARDGYLLDMKIWLLRHEGVMP